MDLADENTANKRTDQLTALQAILPMEESKRNYKNIQNIAGNKKERTSFTQVDILNATDPSRTITLTMKHNIKHAIMNRNQHHASQSLQTPCTTIQGLENAIDPNNNNSCIEQILHGSFIDGLH